MRPLRLALIAHRFQPNDGQGLVNYQVACAAAAAGHKVTLLTAHCAEDLADHPNIRVLRCGVDALPAQLLRDLLFALATTWQLWRRPRAFDAVQANGFTTFWRCDVATAHFVHAHWRQSAYYPFRGSLSLRSLYQRLFTGVNVLLERLAFRRARVVVAVSAAVAAETRKITRLRQEVVVIENGVDGNRYQPGRNQEAGRESFGLPAGVPLALFVGDIRTARKGFDTVLEALAQVPDLHLAVAAETHGSPFPELAHRLGLAERVSFLGKTTRVDALMRSADDLPQGMHGRTPSREFDREANVARFTAFVQALVGDAGSGRTSP